MNHPLVSICIPAFNSSLYIEETLRSIISQTYKNIEIIVSDNGSTDDTGNIVRKLIDDDSRIKYLSNKSNIGFAKNIQKVVSLAESEYVAIYHADDLYEPGIVEAEIELLLSDSEIGGVFVRHREFWNKKTTYRDFPVFDQLKETSLYNQELNSFIGEFRDYIPALLSNNNFFACPSFMTRKSVFLEIGGFTNTYPSNEDLELWIKYLSRGYKLAIINKILFYYRRTMNQASYYYEHLPELYTMYKVIDEMILCHTHLISEKDKRNYDIYKSRGYLTAAFNAYSNKKPQKLRQNLKCSIELFQFPLLTLEGFMQTSPQITFFLRQIKRSFDERRFRNRK